MGKAGQFLKVIVSFLFQMMVPRECLPCPLFQGDPWLTLILGRDPLGSSSTQENSSMETEHSFDFPIPSTYPKSMEFFKNSYSREDVRLGKL